MFGATRHDPSIDHICVGVRNHYNSTAALFDQAGLISEDGGWYPELGVGQRWIALQGARLEIECVIDPLEAERSTSPDGRNLLRATSKMDVFTRWGITGDVERQAKRLGQEPRMMVRRLADGAEVSWRVVPDPWDAMFLGMPVVTDFHQSNPAWSSGSDAVISKIEVGGDKALIQGWIGPAVEELPVDYVGGAPGIRAATVRWPDGRELTLRCAQETAPPRTLLDAELSQAPKPS